jgi:hypothetical protein
MHPTRRRYRRPQAKLTSEFSGCRALKGCCQIADCRSTPSTCTSWYQHRNNSNAESRAGSDRHKRDTGTIQHITRRIFRDRVSEEESACEEEKRETKSEEKPPREGGWKKGRKGALAPQIENTSTVHTAARGGCQARVEWYRIAGWNTRAASCKRGDQLA